MESWDPLGELDEPLVGLCILHCAERLQVRQQLVDIDEHHQFIVLKVGGDVGCQHIADAQHELLTIDEPHAMGLVSRDDAVEVPLGVESELGILGGDVALLDIRLQ